MKNFALATAALGLAVTATPAFAGPVDVPVAKVSTAGLDLASTEGQEILDQRIKRAAKKVCRVSDVHTGSRLQSAEVRKCYQKARASAKQQVAAIMEDQRLGG